VPDIGEQQDRGEDQRTQRGQRLHARVTVQDDQSGERRRRDHP